MNAEQFYTSALQLAAHEARQGHTGLANDIRAMVDRARKKPALNNVIAFPQALAGLILTEQPARTLASLVVDDALKTRIKRVILEFRQQEKLKKHGLSHRRKLLLSGEPGTGKTMTAQVLATELKQPLHIIQMDRLVTKFMGETGAKLRQIFERMRAMPGVYLFDEFDAIGGERDLGNDVGEMRRVLNAFLQFIENDTSNNLIIAATNNPRLLDRALFRRFDDVLHYALPVDESRKHLIANLLGTTGASMLLIRPMLRTNSQREYVKHIPLFFIFLVVFFGNYFVAELYTFVTNIYRRACNELFHLILALSAKRTQQVIIGHIVLAHNLLSYFSSVNESLISLL